MPVTAVIVAAGSGERLGAGRPKALVELAGRPMYEWSLRALAGCPAVDQVVLAAPPGHEPEFSAGQPWRPDLPFEVVAGGASRSESVARASSVATGELILVHDAARPLVTPELAGRLIEELAVDPGRAAVIAAAPVADTIKRAEPEAEPLIVRETLERRGLWAVQTPQVFRADLLREALAGAEQLAAATDDAMLIELLGHQVRILPWSEPNLKVTTSADLVVAEALLRP